MPKMTVYCILVYRNKQDPSSYDISTHTLSGTGLSGRIQTILTVDAKSRLREGWELVSFSHAFLPFAVRYQL